MAELKIPTEEVSLPSKGLARELKVPIWSVSQVNRAGAKDDIIEGDKAAGSYDKIMITDVAISLSRKKEDKVKGTGRFHIMKNRYGMDGLTFGAKIDTSILTSSNYTDAILKELKTPSKNSFKNIRQILADSNLDDFEEIYRFLYDNLDEYGKNDLAKTSIIIEIENYMYHANFRIDKEINVMALICSILPK